MPNLYKNPSRRHEEIALIANHLGSNVASRDVKVVIEAIRVEYEHREKIETFYKDVAVLCKEVSYA